MRSLVVLTYHSAKKVARIVTRLQAVADGLRSVAARARRIAARGSPTEGEVRSLSSGVVERAQRLDACVGDLTAVTDSELEDTNPGIPTGLCPVCNQRLPATDGRDAT